MGYIYKISITRGVIFSVILIFKDLIFSNFFIISMLLTLIIGTTMGYYSVKLFKKNNGGYSDFGQTFSIVFLVWIVGFFISFLFDILIYKVILFSDSPGSYSISKALSWIYFLISIPVIAGICALISIYLKSPKDKSTNIDSSL